MKLVGSEWADDTAARKRIQEDLEVSMVVEAAAGAGKTTQLIGRLVAVLAAGHTTVERVVAVTFTRKAAGELKLRLRQELERALCTTGDEAVRERLEHAVAHLEETRIGTIHSFCAELLRERPVEAGVDPGFVEVADDEGPALFARAFNRWIQGQLAIMPEGLRRALSRLALQSGWFGGSRSTPLERLRDAGWKLAEWRDYPAEWQRPPFDREPLIDRLVDLVARLASHARRCPNAGDPLRRSLEPIVLLDTWIRRSGFDLEPKLSEDPAEHEADLCEPLPPGVLRFPTPADGGARTTGDEPDPRACDEVEPERLWEGELRVQDYDALEARLLDLRVQLRKRQNQKKGRGKFAEALPREQVAEERDLFVECLDHFQRVADADLAALLQRELRGVLEEYERIKRQEGRLDFSDLLLQARQMLVEQPAVRRDLQERISHIFIDEFQDTDPVQAEVLLLLTADDPSCSDWAAVRPVPGKLFAVGDPKQSIYRFRRADVRLYEAIKERLTGNGVAILELGRSFRSNEQIQRLVNAAFAEEMDGDAEAGRPSYLPLGEYRKAPEDRPSVVTLPVPEPYAWRYVAQRSIEESLPGAVAAYCQWLIRESGWTVEENEGRVPIRPRHICVLFRRYMSWGRDVTRPYTQGLEDRGIPHLLIGARTFHQREEVETLRSALAGLEWPDDELSAFATLHGSLFAFSDELLLRFRHAVGGFSPLAWRRFQLRRRYREEIEDRPEELPEDLGEVGRVLERLLEMHRARNRRAVVETVQDLLDWTRARAGFALRPAGHQVLANVERVCELARAYELGGGRSFRGFVEHLEEEASKPSSTVSPVVEDGADGVRIMTVHSAKGLEFPVVILADMTAGLTTREPDQAVDPEEGLCAMKLLGCAPLDLIQRMEIESERDRAEGMRVAYVAATRARDLLVVPAVGDEQRAGWLEPLNKALYPARADRREAADAVGCPDFGPRSILERPMEVDEQHRGAEDPSVRPGLHVLETPQRTRYGVVWWDPAVLELEARPEVGLAREGLLSPRDLDSEGKAPAPAASANEERYRRWQVRRAHRLDQGAAPSRSVVAVTELEVAPPGGLREVELVELPRRPGRPGGMRFGDLVHTTLRLVDLRLPAADAAAQAAALAGMNARVLGATEGEQTAAAEAVAGLVQSELGARLRAADAVWREVAMSAQVALDDAGSGDGGTPAAGGVLLVDAVIDLLFREGDRWTVADFKTDSLALSEGVAGADGDSGLERYRRQVSWYAEVASAAGNLAALGGADAGSGAGEPELLIVQL